MSVLSSPDRSSGLADANGRLWVVAILFFIVGDLVTTSAGLGVPGVREIGPLAAPVLEWFGLGGIVLVKALFLGGLYAVWTVLPSPQRVGVPLGLAAVGVAATGWNVAVLTVAVVP